MNRTELLNYLIKRFNYSKYLEIGHETGVNFNAIKLYTKFSVDPSDQFDKPSFLMTSDEFFKHNTIKFDLIFIDGLHHKEQVKKDVENSIKFLNENGTIVLHDCNPKNEIGTRIPSETSSWWGDVWKEFVRIRQNENIDAVCTKFDEGCGILRIRKNSNLLDKFETYNLSFNDLDLNRKDWLNLKPFNEIEKWL